MARSERYHKTIFSRTSLIAAARIHTIKTGDCVCHAIAEYNNATLLKQLIAQHIFTYKYPMAVLHKNSENNYRVLLVLML
jgi:hypothetical protein